MSSGRQRLSKDILYLQSQNGNLFARGSSGSIDDTSPNSELDPLRSDVPKDISWCSDALGPFARLATLTSLQVTIRAGARCCECLDW